MTVSPIESPGTGQDANLALPTNLLQKHYAHLRGGAIVPLQMDAKGNDDVKTIHDLQQMPVDLHINILKDGTSCGAVGRLLVDDGLVLDYKGY